MVRAHRKHSDMFGQAKPRMVQDQIGAIHAYPAYLIARVDCLSYLAIFSLDE